MKKRGLFGSIIAIVFVFMLVNVGLLVYWNNAFQGGMTGLSVKDAILDTYSGRGFIQKAILIIQAVIFIGLIVFIAIRHKTKKSIKPIPKQELDKAKKENTTDIDALYQLLLERKEISLPIIAKSFNIKKDLAREWGKILESSDLAILDYPTFGEPSLKLKNGKEKAKQEEK
ncbi:MAG: hypothetical protein ACP5D2_01435 [Candidatus Nanoarchaeia archaeon]